MVAAQETCEVYRLGKMDFQAAWELQEHLAGEISQGNRPPTLLLLEHPHTYTFGRRGKAGNLLWDENQLASHGVNVQWIDRGGDVTYHGPGQLVGYPLLPLGALHSEGEAVSVVDYVGYLRRLEAVLIATLARFGLGAGQRKDQTGVWLQPDVVSRCKRCDPSLRQPPAKIASIGVKVDVHGISRHGFALNVDPDMHYWEGIVPCGLEGVMMVSLADFLEPVPAMSQVMDYVTASFEEVFSFKMISKPQLV